jgi:RNA polymerase sigma factor (sigma-70 family)
MNQIRSLNNHKASTAGQIKSFTLQPVNDNRFAHITDQELLEKFYADGNNEWLGILLQRYTLLLFGVCMKYMRNEAEAKDCVQQVFLKSITELGRYRVTYFKSWLYMVAKNHCLMKLRDKHPSVDIEKLHLSAEETLKQDHIDKDKVLSVMEDCLQYLNEEQKTAVTLFYLEKKSYQEIADITGYTTLQVKSYIQNGKRNLRNLVEKKMKETSARP